MPEAQRTIHIVTGDEVVRSTARAAVSPLDGWELSEREAPEELLNEGLVPGDVILLDGSQGSVVSVYETCRGLAGNTRCRTFLLLPRNRVTLAAPIASFCGATGVLEKPLSSDALRFALEATGPPSALPMEARESGGTSGEMHGTVRAEELPERLLRDLTGKPSESLIHAMIDPETSLFNFEFLLYKLDEEYKRALRFGYPLSCVMLGFEGPADEGVLNQLASIFLSFSRDTDVMGRFDESSFLFLLPNTGPDGAQIMAQRIGSEAEQQGLADLVGDRLSISVGISSFPHPDVHRREDLYQRARDAYLEAQRDGGGLIQTA